MTFSIIFPMEQMAPTSRLTPGMRLRGAFQRVSPSRIHSNTLHLTYPSASGEVKSLTHCQLRKVYVGLSLVNALSSEVLVHGLLRNTLIIQIRVLCDIEPISLSRDDFQERRTATALVSNVIPVSLEHHLPSRPSQYHKHLSTLDQAIEVFQDLNPSLLSLPNKPFG